MIRKLGFTLIELLTVIAIIAILAAITFPVYARAKESAFRNSDLANMNAIRTSLQLYRVDQGGYPPALLGYVTLYDASGGVVTNNIVPANQLKSYLFPKRIDGLTTLQPRNARFKENDFTTAVWPNQDPRAVGTAGVVDTNGDGVVNGADDIGYARQAFGPNHVVQGPTPQNPFSFGDAYFYPISGYDVAQVRTPGGTRFELRYALFWTCYGYGNGSVDCGPEGSGKGNAMDDPRQLGYDDPPETTVVTWDSYFRDYNSDGTVPHGKKDMVLFLGGSARPFDSADLNDRSWRVMP